MYDAVHRKGFYVFAPSYDSETFSSLLEAERANRPIHGATVQFRKLTLNSSFHAHRLRRVANWNPVIPYQGCSSRCVVPSNQRFRFSSHSNSVWYKERRKKRCQKKVAE